MEISNLAQKIFSDEIKPPKSIQIEFENIENIKELFESLISIFTEGMIILYGTNGKVDLEQLGHENLEKMVQYFWSIGIQIYVHKFYVKQIEELENANLSNNNLSLRYKLVDDELSPQEIVKIYPEHPKPEYLVKYTTINNGNLIDYKYQLRVKDSIYIIYFELL